MKKLEKIAFELNNLNKTCRYIIIAVSVIVGILLAEATK